MSRGECAERGPQRPPPPRSVGIDMTGRGVKLANTRPPDRDQNTQSPNRTSGVVVTSPRTRDLHEGMGREVEVLPFDIGGTLDPGELDKLEVVEPAARQLAIMRTRKREKQE